MLGFVVVLLRLFALVNLKLSENILYKIFNIVHVSFGWFVSNFASLAESFYQALTKRGTSYKGQGNNHKKLGIVVITGFTIPERAFVREKHVDQLHVSFKNPFLFERVIAESSVNSLMSWISSGIQSTKLSCHIDSSFFLVYKKNYTSAYSLSGWFNILPLYKLRKPKYEKSIQKRVTENVSHSLPADLASRIIQVISVARDNTTRLHTWEDPDAYNGRIRMRKPTLTFYQFSESSSLCKHQHLQNFKYLTVEGSSRSQLLEIALRAAQRADSDYVIVINPRAMGLNSDLLNSTLDLLQNNSVDIVLGISKPCKLISSFSSFGNRRDANGLYLLGLRAGRHLTCTAKALTSNVEWSSSATATQFWNNVTRTSATNWNIACLRKQLEEIMEPADLLSLESHTGLPVDHILKDSISVIIPMGPGHLDDGLDSDADEEYINVQSSKNLKITLDLAVHNASGSREIQIIIISSEPFNTAKSTTENLSSTQESERFLGTRLRPMITISMHHYDPIKANCQDFDAKYPKRGELIRYASEHLATGSMLVFIEPGVQLPVNWDSAVFHTLMRPGVGMGCFSYRLQLQEKYVYRKSLTWAFNSYLANWLVNQQTYRFEVPFAGQPHFIYAYYLSCIGGYPRSSRLLHCIDLALNCHQGLGTVAITHSRTYTAGVPAEFALRHGALRMALYVTLISAARYLGATESQLNRTLLSDWQSGQTDRATRYRLPLIQPHYLDGY